MHLHEFSCSLVHLFILLSSSSLVPCILRVRQVGYFPFDKISAIKFGFPVLLIYSFYIFLSYSLVWLCPLSICKSISRFPFLTAFWFFLCLIVLFLPSYVVSRFSLLTWRIFLCQIPSLCPDKSIFSLPVLGFSIFFFTFGQRFVVVHVH